MSWVARGAAREKLREATGLTSEIEIVDAHDQVTLVVDKQRMTLATDGRASNLNGHQRSGTVQAVREKGNLVISVTGASGSRRTTYLLSQDGRTLTQEIEMTAVKLPKLIRYQVSYIRK